MLLSVKASFRWPAATLLSGDGLRVAWSPLPQGNDTTFKRACCLFFATDVILSISSREYFPSSLTVKQQRVARTGESAALHHSSL